MDKPSNTFTPAPRRRHGRSRRAAAPSAGPAALVLASAALEFDGQLLLRISFDRDVNADSMDASQIIVQDPTGTGYEYAGDQLMSQPSPNELLIQLAQLGPAQGSSDVMTATNATGIVAVDDGGTWAGVTDLGLPFP